MAKLSGINYEIDDTAYMNIFGTTAMSVTDDEWLYERDGTYVMVRTDSITGGAEACLGIDRERGVLGEVATIEMDPVFTLISLQQRVLTPDCFERASEDLGTIRIPQVPVLDLVVDIIIYPNPGFSMCTVDAVGAPV